MSERGINDLKRGKFKFSGSCKRRSLAKFDAKTNNNFLSFAYGAGSNQSDCAAKNATRAQHRSKSVSYTHLAIFLFPSLFAAIGQANATLFVAIFPLIGLLAAIFILPEVYGYERD